eukprot:TRINITY_DN7963_c0_g1_i2.p2 TRINITY_DN7963_c0_g1~~TRINITY_DN7963_c0_g1_i2.p2  ORF type:complete len:133 (+),score=1.55 TRINITY_DN7963_c0_g1_i2:198-596(+)
MQPGKQTTHLYYRSLENNRKQVTLFGPLFATTFFFSTNMQIISKIIIGKYEIKKKIKHLITVGLEILTWQHFDEFSKFENSMFLFLRLARISREWLQAFNTGLLHRLATAEACMYLILHKKIVPFYVIQART